MFCSLTTCFKLLAGCRVLLDYKENCLTDGHERTDSDVWQWLVKTHMRAVSSLENQITVQRSHSKMRAIHCGHILVKAMLGGMPIIHSGCNKSSREMK